MDKYKFKELMKADGSVDMEGDNALRGLELIRKILDPNGALKPTVLCAAEHDIIYSVGISELIDAGITEEDVVQLRKLNWMCSDDTLSCFI